MFKLSLQLIAVLFMAASANAQLNLSFQGNLTYAQNRGDCSDIWGYVDEFGNEYAIVGNETGTSIVDVTDPTNPTEIFYSAGAQTIWRDMKVWGDYAYITNEGNNGLKIIDLTNLPGALNAGDVYQYTGSTYNFTTAHNIFIDEVGHAYITGANNGVGGAIILDLTNPTAPTELGRYNDYYMHDIFVRGDTLWGGAINDGFFVVVDVSNPAACVTMATQFTPTTFSHNVWLSDDGNTLFTTDEVSNAYIAAYDVSDINNISERDRIQSSPGMNVIPHNTFTIGNFVVTSYYRDGVTIHDATNPNNLIEVGNYDTSPQFSGDGFNGCWGVYPYLPSGNIIASDIENGVFVLAPNYVQGAYLEGIVTDAVTTNPINNALVQLVSTTFSDNTNLSGDYATGVGSGGTFDVTYSKLGYVSQTITGVVLTNGVTTTLDVQLIPIQTINLMGTVIDENSNPISGAQVLISNSQYSTIATTNGLGEFDVPGFLEDTYDVTIGIWGYHTLCLPNQVLNQANNPYVYQLATGYSDYFDLDLGWTISGNPATGDWERGEPNGTTYQGAEANPEFDSQDCGEMAYVTGNGGGQAGSDDIDDGETVLSSPIFDLSGYYDAYLSFERWFFNDGGNGTPNDSLVIELSNGTQSVVLDFADENDPDESSWALRDIHVSDFLTPTASMQIKVRAMDLPGGHLVEAGFDNFVVRDSLDPNIGIQALEMNRFEVYPNPFTAEINISLDETYQNVTVELFEIATGKLVASKTYSDVQKIEMTAALASGIYILRLQSDDQLIGTKRIVKM